AGSLRVVHVDVVLPSSLAGAAYRHRSVAAWVTRPRVAISRGERTHPTVVHVAALRTLPSGEAAARRRPVVTNMPMEVVADEMLCLALGQVVVGARGSRDQQTHPDDSDCDAFHGRASTGHSPGPRSACAA